MNQQAQPTKEMSTLDALRFAIWALNDKPNFPTTIPDPKKAGRYLKSYELLSIISHVASCSVDQ